MKDSYAASQEDIETDPVIGVLLEKGYDKNNLTVEFSGGKKAVTIEESELKEDEDTYVDAKDQYGSLSAQSCTRTCIKKSGNSVIYMHIKQKKS